VTVTGTDDDLQTMLGTARVQVADNKRVYGEAKAGTRMVKVLVSETVDYTQYIDPLHSRTTTTSTRISRVCSAPLWRTPAATSLA
jgi:hypothetical protein